jgi:hypothetical protein
MKQQPSGSTKFATTKKARLRTESATTNHIVTSVEIGTAASGELRVFKSRFDSESARESQTRKIMYFKISNYPCRRGGSGHASESCD